MRRCSYTWEEQGRKKQCPEEIWSGSSQYCIFHDPSSTKNTKLFQQKLNEKLAEKDYNFIEYCFPEVLAFRNRKFEEDVNFGGATFLESVDFREATFEEDTSFVGATFKEKADFNKVIFQEDAFFIGTTFLDYAFFSEATFEEDTSFVGATFKEKADFSGATFERALFSKATFKTYASFSGATFERADFSGATFERADFYRTTFEEYANLWEATLQDVDFGELEIIYRNLKQKMQRDGNYSQAGNFYYHEMEMKRKGTKLSIGRLWLEFYRRLAGYGENPELVAINSFIVILLGAIFFFFAGIAVGSYELPAEESPYVINYTLTSLDSDYAFRDFLYCGYYSVVTFTTLGYGDIHSLGSSRLVASVEALIGVFFMALFVVVFARKMMR